MKARAHNNPIYYMAMVYDKDGKFLDKIDIREGDPAKYNERLEKMFTGTEVQVDLYKYRQMSKRVIKAAHLPEFFTKEEREAYGKLLKKANKKKRKSPTRPKSYIEKEIDELDELERYFEEEYNEQDNDEEDVDDDED